MDALLILAVVIIGAGTMLGQVRAQRLWALLVVLLVGPILLCVIASAFHAYYESLSLAPRVLVWLLAPFLLLLLLRILFPKGGWLGRTVGAMLEVLTYAATFPVRFIWRGLRLITTRERQPIRLARHHPVVGHRPPLQIPVRHDDDG